jgi:hypothetical protein
MKVCLAVPNGGTVKARTMSSLIPVVAHLMIEGIGIVWAECEATFSFHNRWKAALQAIEANCDYVWFIDADQTIPHDAFFTLQKNNKEIVGAAYNYRRFPLMSTVKTMNRVGELLITHPDHLPKELFSVGAMGFGCILIKVDALKRIPQPWFACEWDQTTGELILTEDHWFSRQARVAGYETWCDPTVDVKHIGDFLY